MFFDDGDISWKGDVQRVIHPAQKYEGNPVLKAEEEWEGKRAFIGGTVRKEGNAFRMWYQGTGGGGLRGYQNHYAKSRDGVNWTKPALKICRDCRGSLENNFYLAKGALRAGNREPGGDHNQSVLYTPHMGEGRTYTMLSYGGARGFIPYNGYGLSFSDDGIHWIDGPDVPVIPGFADVGWFTYDRLDGKFRGIVKSYLAVRGLRRRSVLWTESDDAFRWSLPIPAVLPDAEDEAWAEGREGHYTQFYGMPIFRYENTIVGLLQVFKCIDGGRSTDGFIDVQLVSSRDGRTWKRVGDRSPVIERGPEGAWDWGIVQTGNSLVIDGDLVRAYFTGSRHRHGFKKEPGFEEAVARQTWQAIGMGTWPRDRIVGLRAGSAAGQLDVVSAASGELHVNGAAAGGSLVVELIGADRKPLPGFEAGNCIPLEGDALDHTVRWRGEPSLAAPAGGAVTIRLTLANAEIFSLWWR